MIAYVDCLSTEPAGKCWNSTYYEDEDELLPLYTRKLSNLQPKTEGSLRRRLLTAKIHQQQDALWAPKTLAGPASRKHAQFQNQLHDSYNSTCRERKAVSSLDEESKWSVHYKAPWHQQENVFLPGSRPACVEDLHQQAKVNLKTVLRECDKLRKDGFRSSQYYSQSPAFAASNLSENVQLDEEKTEKKKKRSKVLDSISQSCLFHCCHLKSWRRKDSESPTEEEKLVYSMPPQSPLLERGSNLDIQSRWTGCFPLPTPEEKMRIQAQSVLTDVIPINITGENFDRQASFRKSSANTDTIIRRPKRVQRRKTITGVPNNIQTELANKQLPDSKNLSMCMGDRYSTLSRVGSVNSTLRHSVTRDSSCQTEEAKVVPPSVRRIRAQRGQGIAAQMANVSSSSISTMSDCTSVSYTQLNDSDQSFHSLPRQSSHNTVQLSEPKYSSSPYRANSGSTSSLSYEFDMQHDSSSSLHNLSGSRNNVNSPIPGEFKCRPNAQLAKHSHYQGYDPNASLNMYSLRSSQHISAEFKSNIPGYKNGHLQSPRSSSRLLSSSDASMSAVSSCYESTGSLCTGMYTETDSQCSTLDNKNCSGPRCVRRDSNFSESSSQSCSTVTNGQWTCEVPSKDATSNCSSSVSSLCKSEEQSPSKTETSSLFSVDNDGLYSTMPLDCSLKSHSHGCINNAGSLYECKDFHSQGSYSSLHSNRSLTRSISLRKAKKPPLPPTRTDSLRRRTQRKSHHSGSVLSEQLISTLQQSLELNLKTHSGSFSGGFEDPWVLRPRSQSTVSAASGKSAPAAVCPVTPTHSESSNYAESWDFYVDYPDQQLEQCSSPNLRLASVEENPLMCSRSKNTDKVMTKSMSSPDKVQRLTSPSSGYSSQSNTPTAGTPVISLIRSKSTAGRPKPKVPERKSSLRSSVSSSSTSLSSNTSDSVKNFLPQSDLNTVPCELDTTSSCFLPEAMMDPPPLLPPPPPPVPDDLTLEENSSSDLFATPKKSEIFVDDSIDFPPLPPYVVESRHKETVNHPLLPPKPSLSLLAVLPPPPPPPPLPNKGLHSPATVKTEKPFAHTNAKHNEKGPSINLCGGQENPSRPIITTQALQMVQLRPVKLMQLEISTPLDNDHFKDQEHHLLQVSSGKPPRSETTGTKVTDCGVSQTGNCIEICEQSVEIIQNVHETSLCSLPAGPEKVSGTAIEETLKLTNLSVGTHKVVNPSKLQQSTSCPASPSQSPLKQKPPISPKKPNLSLLAQPVKHLPLANGLKLPTVHEAPMSFKPEPNQTTLPISSADMEAMPLSFEVEDQSDSDSSSPEVKSRQSLSSELSLNSLRDLQLSDIILNEHDLGLSDKDYGLSDDKTSLDDSLSSSSSGSISFKEDELEENGPVSELSSFGVITHEGAVEEMTTPVRARTTEDLFAEIHRSKRKVLGRGDSDEERRCIQPTSPVTPTSPFSSLPRPTGSIQRNLLRSCTTNDSFKALLLKKGCRSEGFRMSATEILKTTDPRFQRVNPDTTEPVVCTSPPASRRAPEEWARSEGVLPRLSTGLTTSKYGRSRTPPSAASSRYNSRSRLLSGPMTVICERDGETVDSTDCSLGAEGLFTLTLTSANTVCAQGST